MFLMTFILAVLLFWEIRSLHRQGENRTMAAYILISLGALALFVLAAIDPFYPGLL